MYLNPNFCVGTKHRYFERYERSNSIGNSGHKCIYYCGIQNVGEILAQQSQITLVLDFYPDSCFIHGIGVVVTKEKHIGSCVCIWFQTNMFLCQYNEKSGIEFLDILKNKQCYDMMVLAWHVLFVSGFPRCEVAYGDSSCFIWNWHSTLWNPRFICQKPTFPQ